MQNAALKLESVEYVLSNLSNMCGLKVRQEHINAMPATNRSPNPTPRHILILNFIPPGRVERVNSERLNGDGTALRLYRKAVFVR
jgi:hypothetical protein